MLRDTEGVTSKIATIPAPLVPVVARFTGAHTVAEIAALASTETGATIPVELVEKLAQELDGALFLESPRYEAERRRVVDEFSRVAVREATHAGGAYHADPGKLRSYVDNDCIAGVG